MLMEGEYVAVVRENCSGRDFELKCSNRTGCFYRIAWRSWLAGLKCQSYLAVGEIASGRHSPPLEVTIVTLSAKI